jgi:hypothetical protein
MTTAISIIAALSFITGVVTLLRVLTGDRVGWWLAAHTILLLGNFVLVSIQFL